MVCVLMLQNMMYYCAIGTVVHSGAGAEGEGYSKVRRSKLQTVCRKDIVYDLHQAFHANQNII